MRFLIATLLVLGGSLLLTQTQSVSDNLRTCWHGIPSALLSR